MPFTVDAHVRALFTASLACFMAAGLIKLDKVPEGLRKTCSAVMKSQLRASVKIHFFAHVQKTIAAACVKILASSEVCSSYFRVYTMGMKNKKICTTQKFPAIWYLFSLIL